MQLKWRGGAGGWWQWFRWLKGRLRRESKQCRRWQRMVAIQRKLATVGGMAQLHCWGRKLLLPMVAMAAAGIGVRFTTVVVVVAHRAPPEGRVVAAFIPTLVDASGGVLLAAAAVEPSGEARKPTIDVAADSDSVVRGL